MVGSAIVRALRKRPGVIIITRDRAQLDLRNQTAVRDFFRSEGIAQVYLAAAKVGGIHANDTYPAEFLYDNLLIETNVIQAAHAFAVNRLLFLGSSCIYPREAEQPIKEIALLNGPLEPTNRAYAIAKIAGLELCASFNRQYGTDFRSLMPTNLYGPGDNFDPDNGHVVPALIRRFHEARHDRSPTVSVWGSGDARREFLHVDDLAAACLVAMDLPAQAYRASLPAAAPHLNVGTGEDLPIRDLARMIAMIVGYAGTIEFDPTKPDGAPRKLLDVDRIHGLGWRHRIELRQGLEDTYRWYLRNLRALAESAPEIR